MQNTRGLHSWSRNRQKNIQRGAIIIGMPMVRPVVVIGTILTLILSNFVGVMDGAGAVAASAEKINWDSGTSNKLIDFGEFLSCASWQFTEGHPRRRSGSQTNPAFLRWRSLPSSSSRSSLGLFPINRFSQQTVRGALSFIHVKPS